MHNISCTPEVVSKIIDKLRNYNFTVAERDIILTALEALIRGFRLTMKQQRTLSKHFDRATYAEIIETAGTQVSTTEE